MKITTEKISVKNFMASAKAAPSGMHGFGNTRARAIADLKRQMKAGL